MAEDNGKLMMVILSILGVFFFGCCCCLIVSAVAAGGGASVLSPTDPRQTLWTSGQKIQSDPLDLSTVKNAKWTTFPTVPSTAADIAASPTVKYTYSMDIFLKGTRQDTGATMLWYHNNQNSAYANHPANPGRIPCFWILSNNWTAGFKGVPHTAHVCTGDSSEVWVAGPASTPAKAVPDDTWTNVTVVADTNKITIYVNGVSVATATAGNMEWQTCAADAWYWNAGNINTGDIKVANFYWWNTPLTDVQVSQLVVPSTATSSVATTSYYVPEPYSKEL